MTHASAVRGGGRYGWQFALVCGLMLLHVVAAGLAGFHIDTARDLSFALDIAEGRRFHLAGPDIGGAFHVGPVWYYVLALPLALGFSLTAMPWFVGLLGASLYGFAYRLGSRLVDRDLGLAMALVLALPSWRTLYWFGATHTALTATLVCAALLGWLTYWQTPGRGRALLAGLAVSLALHGHPTVLPLVTLCALPLLRHRAHTDLPPAFAGLLLPFLPYLIDQWQSGWVDFTRSAGYGASLPVLANLAAAPRVLWNASAAAEPAIASTLLERWPAVLGMANLVNWASYGLALAGSWRLAAAHTLRPLLLGAILLAVATTAMVSASRPFVTYYMVELVSVLAALVVALGCHALLAGNRLWWRVWVLLTLGVAVAAWSGYLHIGSRGRLALPLGHALDFTQTDAPAPIEISPRIYFRHLDSLEAFLCAPGPVAIHGDGAVFMDVVAGLIIRTRCPNHERTWLGGSAADRRHLAGVDCRMLDALAVDRGTRTGGVCWQAPRRLLPGAEGLAAADPAIHPPRRHWTGPDRAGTRQGILCPDEILVIGNLLPAWHRLGIQDVTAEGGRLEQIYSGTTTQAWRLAAAATPTTAAPVTIRYVAQDPALVDAFTIGGNRACTAADAAGPMIR